MRFDFRVSHYATTKNPMTKYNKQKQTKTNKYETLIDNLGEGGGKVG